MSRTDRDMTRWRWNQHFKFIDGVSEHGGYAWDRGRTPARTQTSTTTDLNPRKGMKEKHV